MAYKVLLGDICEIETAKGYGYFQCVGFDYQQVELIRVYHAVFPDPIENLSLLNTITDRFFVGFHIGAALRRKIVRRVGNNPLEEDFERPRFFRDKEMIRGEFRGWRIKDIETGRFNLEPILTESIQKMSPMGVVNDTLLIDWLDSEWGLDNWK